MESTTKILGRSLIAGTPGGPQKASETAELSFRAIAPSTGLELAPPMYAATTIEVAAACNAAWEAFYALAERPAKERAALLDTAAANITALGDTLIDLASEETGLTPPRLISERDRTVNTLRLFAEAIREGSWVRASIDSPDATRRPLSKPDVRRMLLPLGPVAVFGASNFPLAYSAAGTDTSSALAAGCPVVVKGHPSHPGTGELVAHAINKAIKELGLHPGIFSYLHAGGGREQLVGAELVKNPCIRAVGFTGSFGGGMALHRLAAERPDPIPVFAEMGSINPVFLLPQALGTSATSIAERLFASITNSNGQMCTKPGLIFALRGEGLENFIRGLGDAIDRAETQNMLSRRIRDAWVKRIGECCAVEAVEIRAGSMATAKNAETTGPIRANPVLLRTRYEIFRANPTLKDECFGPSSLVVVCQSEGQLIEAATLIQGSLTASIFCGTLDGGLAKSLQRIVELRAGRIIFNGVPTGVEVCDAMVHGGPYPSSNQPHSTAVGPKAMERWCRPVAVQNAPEMLLRPELRDNNPLAIHRILDGRAG